MAGAGTGAEGAAAAGSSDGAGSVGPDAKPNKKYQHLATRKGFRTSIIEKIDTEVIGNKVLSKATIPYVRSKTITFKGYGLLPNTQVYPFFDRRNVAAYVTPASGFTTSGASLVKGGALITNGNGEIQGTFDIPDPKVKGDPKFKTGQIPFRLTSSPTNKQTPYPVTASEALFHATGILRTTQATVRATRNGRAVRTHVTENTKINNPMISGNQQRGGPNGGRGDGPGGGGASCFVLGTPFLMDDGSYKAVEDIRTGDEIYGGIVTGTRSGMGDDDWYSYKDVHVHEEHFVLEDGVWMYVKDSSHAIPIETPDVYYTLDTTNHRLYSINDTVFSDDATFDKDHYIHAVQRHLQTVDHALFDEMLNILNGKPTYELALKERETEAINHSIYNNFDEESIQALTDASLYWQHLSKVSSLRRKMC